MTIDISALLAFACGMHGKLGQNSPVRHIDPGVFEHIGQIAIRDAILEDYK